ncbi:MAG: zinc-ribbon domain-containing protein, partial [Dehalococcoidia bacterium]
MRCQTCGEELREGARFCPTCGTPTQPGAAQTPQTVQIRRAPPQPSDQSPEATVVVPPAAEEQRQEPSAERPSEPAPRPSRDPGAGYDPVGPPRPTASQSGARRTAGASSTVRSAGGLSLTAPSSADFNTLIQRLLRLARLDTGVFGELYADAGATIPVAIFAAIVLI